MKEKLIEIINEMKQVLEKKGFHLSDFEIMDLALRLYNTEKINQSRDSKQMNNWEKNKPLENETPKESKFEPMTDGQIKFFNKNKLEITKDMTKEMAWKKIKEIKK